MHSNCSEPCPLGDPVGQMWEERGHQPAPTLPDPSTGPRRWEQSPRPWTSVYMQLRLGGHLARFGVDNSNCLHDLSRGLAKGPVDTEGVGGWGWEEANARQEAGGQSPSLTASRWFVPSQQRGAGFSSDATFGLDCLFLSPVLWSTLSTAHFQRPTPSTGSSPHQHPLS